VEQADPSDELMMTPTARPSLVICVAEMTTAALTAIDINQARESHDHASL